MNALTKNAVVVVDGFDAIAQDPSASPIRGTNAKFKDAAYYAYTDKIDTQERAFVALDRLAGWQKLQKDAPAEYLMQRIGEPRPVQPHVDEKDWPLNLNGVPENPWKWTHYLHLLDAATGEIVTFWTNTIGGNIAIGQLSDQVAFMRRARPDALPVIALESKDMPTQFGSTKPRPHFRILGWKIRSDIGPQNLLAGPEAAQAPATAPEQLEQFAAEPETKPATPKKGTATTRRGVTKITPAFEEVDKPTAAELLGDEIGF
jgi:hypothetical protein